MINNLEALQMAAGVALAVATAAVIIALTYTRRALGELNKTRAVWERLSHHWEMYEARYNSEPAGPEPDAGRLPGPIRGVHLSLKCRVYGSRPHLPCSGTCDCCDVPSPCGCYCHDFAADGTDT